MGDDRWQPQQQQQNNYLKQGGPSPQQNYNQSTHNNDFMNRNTSSFVPETFPKPAEHNDCEIIVVARTLTEYAESIENHLKRMGLSVDLLFPNDDVPIGKVLGNISLRGTLYAILVTPQNEEHRSITVNILYDKPAEHRNMPVEDAMNLIVTNFKEKLNKDKMGPSAIGGVTGGVVGIGGSSNIKGNTLSVPPLNERHPESIQTMFNLLAGNRPLTVLQYDRVIGYLQERRELQVKDELGGACDISTTTTTKIPMITNQELELQQKILNILNKPSITAPTPPIIPDILTQSSIHNQAAPSNLLLDPIVQKALDSILQTNFQMKK